MPLYVKHVCLWSVRMPFFQNRCVPLEADLNLIVDLQKLVVNSYHHPLVSSSSVIS